VRPTNAFCISPIDAAIATARAHTRANWRMGHLDTTARAMALATSDAQRGAARVFTRLDHIFDVVQREVPLALRTAGQDGRHEAC
jgi:hypothetical protein